MKELKEIPWLTGNYGVMCHYLIDQNNTLDKPEMALEEWIRQVEAFDAEALAEQVADSGASWLIFTLGQNTGYYCSPNKTYDSIVGRKPSRLTDRDLMADIACALKKRDVRLIAYLPSHAPAFDRQAVEALQCEQVQVYGYLADEELDVLYRKVRQVVVPLRFGAGVKGKVLEAIQKNRPLVTTSVGAEGVPEAASVMNIVDSAEEFADMVRRIDAGDAQMIEKMSSYRQWLALNFGKDNAAGIISRDFGSARKVGDTAAVSATASAISAAQE